MTCAFCKNDEPTQFFEEVYPCGHCGGYITLGYHRCRGCGLMWKTVDGSPIVDTAFDGRSAGIEEELFNFLEDIHDEIGDAEVYKKKDDKNKDDSMKEMIQHCIKCNELAYQIEAGLYKCSTCGFEWEIIDCG